MVMYMIVCTCQVSLKRLEDRDLVPLQSKIQQPAKIRQPKLSRMSTRAPFAEKH